MPEVVLNCSVDTNTSQYMASGHNPSNLPSVLPSAIATLKVENITVMNKLKEVLRDSASCADIYQCIKTKTGWTIQLMDNVRWSALEAAFKILTLGNKVCVLKFQHNWLPTAKHMNEIYPQESAICPVCDTEVET
eukprot:15366971-Ditylum_brightwellii.AAC.1